MRELVYKVTSMMMRTWHLEVIESLASAPRARGDPFVRAAGPSPIRTLIFGDGLAAGWGVTTHELAIPGEFSRSLASLTGRGVEVDIAAHLDLRVHGMQRAISQFELEAYDVVILFLGAGDSISMTPRTEWKNQMSSLLGGISSRTALSARIIVVGQSPIRPVPPFNNVFGRMTNKHAVVLNTITEALCTKYARASFVMLPVVESPPTERLGTPDRYRDWGRFLAFEVLPSLEH